MCNAGSGLSSGVTRVGVTRGGNKWCHPIFFIKTDDLFLVIALWKVTTLFSCHLLVSSHVVYPVFFLNSATKNFYSGVTPWMVSPGEGSASLVSDATGAVYCLALLNRNLKDFPNNAKNALIMITKFAVSLISRAFCC